MNFRFYSLTEGKSDQFVKWKKNENKTNKNKLRGFSPQANYTDRATAAYRRS
jgi:hypothetical protein